MLTACEFGWLIHFYAHLSSIHTYLPKKKKNAVSILPIINKVDLDPYNYYKCQLFFAFVIFQSYLIKRYVLM